MKILQLISHLGCSGAARQLLLLAPGLAASGYEIRIAVLAGELPLSPPPGRGVGVRGSDAHADSLRRAGIPVSFLGSNASSRRFDPVSLWKLRSLLRAFQPDVIHTWGDVALRMMTPLRPSGVLMANNALGRPGQHDGLLKRWLLRKPHRLIARGNWEADRYLRAGVAAKRIVMVPPAINLSSIDADKAEFERWGRFILCAGVMEPEKGFHHAIWTMDILHIIFPDLNLVLAGEGPERVELEHFTQGIQAGRYIHFLGARSQISSLLAAAQVVWIPSVQDCGSYLAVEAAAAGKPVIASNLPSLREFIKNGATGFLTPPADKIALGRRTRTLLRDPELARHFGETARRQVTPLQAATIMSRYKQLYDAA